MRRGHPISHLHLHLAPFSGPHCLSPASPIPSLVLSCCTRPFCSNPGRCLHDLFLLRRHADSLTSLTEYPFACGKSCSTPRDVQVLLGRNPHVDSASPRTHVAGTNAHQSTLGGHGSRGAAVKHNRSPSLSSDRRPAGRGYSEHPGLSRLTAQPRPPWRTHSRSSVWSQTSEQEGVADDHHHQPVPVFTSASATEPMSSPLSAYRPSLEHISILLATPLALAAASVASQAALDAARLARALPPPPARKEESTLR